MTWEEEMDRGLTNLPLKFWLWSPPLFSEAKPLSPYNGAEMGERWQVKHGRNEYK